MWPDKSHVRSSRRRKANENRPPPLPSAASPDLEDRLDPLEPRYKSRAHVRIGRMLDQYGVLFYYRQPRLILTRGPA